MRAPTLLRALAASILIALAASTASADVSVSVLNGQRFSGDAPAGEEIRIKFPLVKGGGPILRLRLAGSRTPVSFTGGTTGLPALELFLPDEEGAEADDETVSSANLRLSQSVRAGRSALIVRGFDPELLPDGAPRTGIYQLVLRTNALVTTRASGVFREQRARRLRVEGDQDADEVSLELVEGDSVRFSLRRLSGEVPILESLTLANGFVGHPSWRVGRRGSRARFPLDISRAGTGEGTFTWKIGFLEGDQGEFRATVRLRAGAAKGTRPMRLANPPGIPLSVRPIADGALVVSFADPGSDVGAVFDGSVVVVTGEKNGSVVARRYAPDLMPLLGDPSTSFVVATAADFSQGEVPQGHRLVTADGYLFAAVGTQSGDYVRIVKFEIVSDNQGTPTLRVLSGREVVPGTGQSGHDFFLAAGTQTVTLGLSAISSASSHVVYEYSTADLSPVNVGVAIGRPADGLAHTHRAGAVLRTLVDGGDSTHFELWAPDDTDPLGGSDLHRQRYSENWAAAGADQVYAFDYDGDGEADAENEIAPTAVVIDQTTGGEVTATGVTILHYVVPTDGTGAGAVHRRLFDIDGTEIPGSHQVLLGTGFSRPTAFIRNVNVANSFVYVAYSTTAGSPRIMRFPMVR